jgi:hypothetical protein
VPGLGRRRGCRAAAAGRCKRGCTAGTFTDLVANEGADPIACGAVPQHGLSILARRNQEVSVRGHTAAEAGRGDAGCGKGCCCGARCCQQAGCCPVQAQLLRGVLVPRACGDAAGRGGWAHGRAATLRVLLGATAAISRNICTVLMGGTPLAVLLHPWQLRVGRRVRSVRPAPPGCKPCLSLGADRKARIGACVGAGRPLCLDRSPPPRSPTLRTCSSPQRWDGSGHGKLRASGPFSGAWPPGEPSSLGIHRSPAPLRL